MENRRVRRSLPEPAASLADAAQKAKNEGLSEEQFRREMATRWLAMPPERGDKEEFISQVKEHGSWPW